MPTPFRHTSRGFWCIKVPIAVTKPRRVPKIIVTNLLSTYPKLRELLQRKISIRCRSNAENMSYRKSLLQSVFRFTPSLVFTYKHSLKCNTMLAPAFQNVKTSTVVRIFLFTVSVVSIRPMLPSPM